MHKQLYDAEAWWKYLEAGHEKVHAMGYGGGEIKEISGYGHQTEKVGHSECKGLLCLDTEFKWNFVGQDDYDEASDKVKLAGNGLKAIPGTFKVHVVVPH